MVFSSMTFLFIFLPIILIIYYLVPNRTYRNIVLLIGSLIFYSWGEPIYIVLMFISTFNDFFFARLVESEKTKGNRYKAKLFFILSLCVNLGLLGFFKYSGFIITNVNSLFNLNLPIHNLPLPIGISFYTFQTMSYSIDVYMGNVKAQKNIITLGTYVTLFPQLIAGPIVRYITVEDELENRKESLSDLSDGFRRFILGLGKKVIIANQMAIVADTIFNKLPGEVSTPFIWLGAIAYSFQIYFDFSGYSDMAIGLGKMFGFNFLENFNYPYISKSITEFWRKWHISLGTWFRDYLYIPLGGNRVKTGRFIFNIFVVWFLTGLWHGASWNYIAWGVYYGLLLMIEKFLLKGKIKAPEIIKHLTTLVLVIIGWVLFRVENIGQAVGFIKYMFVFQPPVENELLYYYQDILHALPYFIIAFIGSLPLFKYIINKINHSQSIALKLSYDCLLIFIMILSIIYLFGEQYNPFIYFRF